jgi:hypothetical protein
VRGPTCTRSLLPRAEVLFGLLRAAPGLLRRMMCKLLYHLDERLEPVSIDQPLTAGEILPIAADFMTTFYHIQFGAMETQEFRTTPLPYWLICFLETTKGPLRQMYFVVLLPDRTVVQPSVAERL